MGGQPTLDIAALTACSLSTSQADDAFGTCTRGISMPACKQTWLAPCAHAHAARCIRSYNDAQPWKQDPEQLLTACLSAWLQPEEEPEELVAARQKLEGLDGKAEVGQLPGELLSAVDFPLKHVLLYLTAMILLLQHAMSLKLTMVKFLLQHMHCPAVE